MNRKTFLVFMVPSIIVLVLVLAVPMGYSLITSFFDTNLKTSGLGNFIGLKNYANALTNKYFMGSIRTTAIYTVGVVLIEFVAGFGIALLLNTNVPGKSIYFSIIIVPMMITPVAVGLIWKLMLNSELGIVNYLLSFIGIEGVSWLSSSSTALATVMFIDVWQNVPYMVLVLLAGLSSLPAEPYEAAKADGASAWQRFRYMTIPLMVPTIIVVLMMRAINALKTYDLIYVLTKGGPGVSTEVISYHIYQEAFRNLEIGSAASMSYLLVIAIAIIAFIFIRLQRNRSE